MLPCFAVELSDSGANGVAESVDDASLYCDANPDRIDIESVELFSCSDSLGVTPDFSPASEAVIPE